MIARIADFAPDGVACGVGLALEDGAGRFVLCVGGSRYRCPPGQRFFMGIGGHREVGESWADCARREVREEVGAGVELRDSPRSWHLSPDGALEPVRMADRPRPLALYEMVPPPEAPDTGNYRLVIFRSSLVTPPGGLRLSPDEVAAVLALTAAQLVRCLELPQPLGSLLDSGGALLAESTSLDRATALVPIGTARALATLVGRIPDFARRSPAWQE